MNAPERHQCYLLDDDEKRMTYAADERVRNAGTFTINKEDHTVGNLMRMQILRDEATKFAGYQLPHPLDHRCLIKIQTSSASSPVAAFAEAVEGLQTEVELFARGFRDGVAQAKARAPPAPPAAAAAMDTS